jgi:hypothetical protein
MTEVAKVQTPANARKRRFASTNERSAAPGFDKDTLEPSDEAVAERAAAASSMGGKAVHSGAFDSLEEVPPAFSVKKSK